MNCFNFTKLFTLIFTTLVLSACGGGSSSSSNQEISQSHTLSGLITDDPVAGASVKILTLNNNEIKSTIADLDGRYSIDVKSDSISDGYIVEASGGQINGVDFVGTLRGIYSANDDKSQANATLITSLIAKLAIDDSEISRSGTLLNKREAIIQELVDMGMLKKADWFVESPELINLDELRATVQARGVDLWLSQMVTDLADGQLTRDKMRVFVNAHGGLLRSLPSSEFISIFPGKTKSVPIDYEFQGNTKVVTVNKLSGPDWVTVENGVLIIAPNSGQTDYGDFTVKLENIVGGVVSGRTNEIIISLLKKVVLVSGELGVDGGMIENEWKDIRISVEAGKLSQTYYIEYIGGITSAGNLSLWTNVEPDMNSEEMSFLELLQPSFDAIKNNYLQEGFETSTRSLRNTTKYASPHVPTECSPDKRDAMKWLTDESLDGVRFPYVWFGVQGIFDNNLAGLEMGPLANGGDPRLAPTKLVNGFAVDCASALRSQLKESDAEIEGKEAVLFVHGFIRSGNKMGGYDKGQGEYKGEYFGKFPGIVRDAGYPPFIFQWRTNAKFETVATELGRAIKKITDKTGKKVHIVAHSFGGLLSRALIQGLGGEGFSSSYFEKYLASLTTVGTPHSGVFDGKSTVGGIEFSRGTHGLAGAGVNGCRAITCYQAGEDVLLNKRLLGLVDQDYGDFIVNLIPTIENPYPNIPTQILIGLVPQNLKMKRNDYDNFDGMRDYKIEYDFLFDGVLGGSAAGDKLISIFGQRYLADGDNNYLNPLFRSDFINEYILPMDNRSGELFEYGKDDLLVNKYTLVGDNDWSDNSYREDVPFSDLKYFSEGFYHTTGSYGLDEESVDPPKNGILDIDKKIETYKNTEVGLHGCIDIDSEDCNHSTWNYVNQFLKDNVAENVEPSNKIVASGSVKYINASSEVVSLPVIVEVFAKVGDVELERVASFLKEDGSYNINIGFHSNANYIVEFSPLVFGDEIRVVTSNGILTQATLAESNLNFPVITLTDKTPLEGGLSIQVKDGASGALLNGFNVSILNRYQGSFLPEGDDGRNKSDGYMVNVLQGDYTIQISKDGYNNGSAECNVAPHVIQQCIINIVSESQTADGEITAVLSWGESPRDLDSHLIRKTNGSQDYQVYYGFKTGVDASLDRDDTSSYGPETITINSVNQGSVYTYYVYNFSGGENTVLPQSGAKVELNFNGTQRVFNVPNENGRYWKVFEIENGLILPCSSGCVQDNVDSIVRSLNRDDELFKNLPVKQ